MSLKLYAFYTGITKDAGYEITWYLSLYTLHLHLPYEYSQQSKYLMLLF